MLYINIAPTNNHNDVNDKQYVHTMIMITMMITFKKNQTLINKLNKTTLLLLLILLLVLLP